MRTVRVSLCLLAAIVVSSPSTGRAAEPSQVDLFVSGEGGYHTYRIPSLIATKDGTLLAFCEGRKNGRSDSGDIDLLFRRSTDDGKTWSDQQVLWSDGENTCGNPCPVVDQKTGVIWLLLTWNGGKVREADIKAGFGEDSRRVFISSSKDDGRTWAEPRDITSKTKRAEWSWYATGPGAGIQIERGKHAGRLVVPCDHKVAATGKTVLYYSHVVYSDDGGATWQLGGATPKDQCNECEVAELTDGRLMLNMRSYDRTRKNRAISLSDDGGATWSEPLPDATLIEPICQASFRRLRWPDGDKPGVLLFSNPASQKAREKLTVRASYDDGKTWTAARELYSGSSAYSCLAVLKDGSIGCLFERDDYKRITLARFPLDWVTDEKARN